MNMKKIYSKPALRVARIEAEAVIAMSMQVYVQTSDEEEY